jgi:putative peptidoglycan lipid II flippase
MLLANKVRGGVAAYQWAFTFFYLPHALFGVPIFNVLFTAMAEHASREEESHFHERLRDGLSMLVFLLVPIAAFLIAAAQPLARVTLEYGVMTEAGAAKVGRVLEAFALGLPTYSAFLVFTRAFYALGETRLPTIFNAISVAAASLVGTLFFFTFPTSSRIEGLALAHSLGFALGTFLIARAFKRRFGSSGGTRVTASIVRALAVGAVSLALMTFTEWALPEASKVGLLLNLVGTAAVGAAVYLLLMWRMRSAELQRVSRLVRGAR